MNKVDKVVKCVPEDIVLEMICIMLLGYTHQSVEIDHDENHSYGNILFPLLASHKELIYRACRLINSKGNQRLHLLYIPIEYPGDGGYHYVMEWVRLPSGDVDLFDVCGLSIEPQRPNTFYLRPLFVPDPDDDREEFVIDALLQFDTYIGRENEWDQLFIDAIHTDKGVVR